MQLNHFLTLVSVLISVSIGSASDLREARISICSELNYLVRSNSTHVDSIKSRIAQHDGVSGYLCDNFKDPNTGRFQPISTWIDIIEARAHHAPSLAPEPSEEIIDTQKVKNKKVLNNECNRADLWYFIGNTVAQIRLRQAAFGSIMVTAKNCHIHGTIEKDAEGFRFTSNYGMPDDKVIKFQTEKELIEKFMK